MNVAQHTACARKWLLSLALAGALCRLGAAQGAPKTDGMVAGDDDVPPPPVAALSPEDKEHQAWSLLTEAGADLKHSQTRIQALAALGMLRSPQAEKMISDGMNDAALEVRTAAALAAGQTKDPNLTTDLRARLDDREPQVAFTAAVTLWKMGDRSGEDIIMAVIDGERSASATLLHGTEHQISRDLHSPSALARIGAMQGASMLLGPFGYGITAYEYLRRNGGDLSRVSAIELIAEEKTEPVHQELLAALADKDPGVRAASSKALAGYHDARTSQAIFALFSDPKYPVRLTAAAAYLRTTGVPGPAPAAARAPEEPASKSGPKKSTRQKH